MPTTLNAPRKSVPRPPRFDHRRIVDGAGRLLIPSWVLSLVFHAAILLFMGQTFWRPGGFGQRVGSGDGPIGIIAEQWNEGAAGLPGDGMGQPQGPGIGIFPGPAAGAEHDGPVSRADDATADSEAATTAGRPAK